MTVTLLILFIIALLPDASVRFDVGIVPSMIPLFMSSFLLLGIVIFATPGSIVGFVGGGYQSIEFNMLKSGLGFFMGAEVGRVFVRVSKTGGLNATGSAVGPLDGDSEGRFE